MKRHKFPLLLIVVILTAISITTFQQFRPFTATPQKPETTRAVDAPRPSGPRLDSPAVHQDIRSSTARVDLNKVTNDQTDERVQIQDQGVVALTKSDGTY